MRLSRLAVRREWQVPRDAGRADGKPPEGLCASYGVSLLGKGRHHLRLHGEGEPPLLPNYEVLSAPEPNRFVTKHYHECNYLQGLEGSQDGTHVRFLHRF